MLLGLHRECKADGLEEDQLTPEKSSLQGHRFGPKAPHGEEATRRARLLEIETEP